MPSSSATQPHRTGRARRAAAVSGALAACAVSAVLAACASASANDPSKPARLSPEQVAQCREVELAFANNAPDYAAKRDAVARDPVAKQWLVRMFVAEVVAIREGRAVDEGTASVHTPPRAHADQQIRGTLHQQRDADARASRDRVLREIASDRLPTGSGTREQRAIAEIVALGDAAVPVLIADLLQHEHTQLRVLGVELLAHVGAPAIPGLQQVARDGQPRQRRAAARALGLIGADGEVLATLRALARDGDFTVRADALRALHDGGAEAQALLLERLRDDDDAFVRRTAAATLGNFRTKAAAVALCDFVARCERDGDLDGARAGRTALMAMAPDHRPRLPDAWRAFAATLGDDPIAPRATANPHPPTDLPPQPAPTTVPPARR
jgi:hypothetical protein